ncbi:hypothetical protein RvY_11655-2 [Ramazzottius varieornatus]|uniref:Beta-Casp domain-containing protein n=1 Tax=Ramazzottius varieornatus TaxID=947166 RepID=A0A1D1VGT6_RAMVA|nr:hypothetical protein RvY_11655-2 [Ramazzottius varieornatus]
MESSLRSLSASPNRPCFFLQYGDTFILLDCAWDFQPSLRFLPVTQIFTPTLSQLKPWEPAKSWYTDQPNELFENDARVLINGALQGEVPQFQYVDPADIHYILLSNFSQIYALPHLLNGKNFTGKIFATAPTIQLAKDIFQDLSHYLETYSTGTHAERWKSRDYFASLPPAFQQCRPALWKAVCSMEIFEASLKKIEVINFRQVIPLENSITITAFSSGFAMGSCNWTIESPNEKICYLSDSTTLTTHVAPIDLEDLKKADVMIVSSLNMEPTRVVGESLKVIGRTVVDTVKNGGNVLIPFSNPDVLIDLLEYFYLYLEDLPTTIPINVISATARSILSLSQVFSEWLAKEYRDKAYLPEEPFAHGEMVKNSRLKIFPSVDGKFSESYVVPCIVFCSHHSLRCGPAVHLMSQWKTSPKNCLIVTEPEFSVDELVAPYQPLAMKVQYLPMDTRLNLTQLSKVLGATEPKMVILHEKYLKEANGGGTEYGDAKLKCPVGTTVQTYSDQKGVALPIGHKWLKTVAHSAFLSSIPMQENSDTSGSNFSISHERTLRSSLSIK